MGAIKSHVVCALFAVSFVSIATADVFRFVPKDHDLGDLVHRNTYTWGGGSQDTETKLAAGEEIVSASLKFRKIYNWNNADYWLHVNLLNVPKRASGDIENWTDTFRDDSNPGHYFDAGPGFGATLTETYTNAATTPNSLPTSRGSRKNVIYDFSDSDLDVFNNYAKDGSLGLGFDPDCHFYNRGIVLRYETNRVPVPGAVLLGFLGLATAGIRLGRRV
ncbi:MAG: hypothetical protein GY809_17700 [Planctomycetes bacterium]|nr:hypothetical protein [Planctomycetota bacterium]